MSESQSESAPAEDGRRHWLDEPKNVDKVFWALVVACALLFAVDFFLHRHAHWSWEELPGFYGIFGFAAFWCIVIAGKHLRKVLMREEDYYDP